MSIFLWGFFGSLGLEVACACAAYQRGHGLPARYARKVYWLLRVSLAVCGGALAVGYGVQNPILAVQIGVTTPYLLRMFEKQAPTLNTSEAGAAATP